MGRNAPARRALRTRLTTLAAAVAASLVAAAPAHAANPVETENANPGSTTWQFASAPTGAIEGYTSTESVDPGGSLQLSVSAPSARYRVEAYRLGWYGGAGA